MATRTILDKLSILADAAKYDASCASSAAPKRHSRGGRGLGSTEGAGICHSYTPDGRCVSLLKILLTNFCTYDCAYCVNRVSSNVPRARFSVDEVVALTLDFYRRNYIEGLFLSSGIIRSPDYTMGELIRVAKTLRIDHDFRGYIHLKVIPDASPDLVTQAGLYADRVSVNIELPTEKSLVAYAPEKTGLSIKRSMGRLSTRISDAKAERAESPKAPRFAPAGQSTQMIVGADAARDVDILATSANLYASYRLRRVYYSAFSPIPDTSVSLPAKPPPLMREHRLYQADWLFRFYGFSVDEISSAAAGGMFDLAIDPKLAWALANRQSYPIDVNRASLELLYRVPGLGVRAAKKIVAARRYQKLRLADVGRLTVSIARIRPFITALDWHPGGMLDRENLRAQLAPAPAQLSLL